VNSAALANTPSNGPRQVEPEKSCCQTSQRCRRGPSREARRAVEPDRTLPSSANDSGRVPDAAKSRIANGGAPSMRSSSAAMFWRTS